MRYIQNDTFQELMAANKENNGLFKSSLATVHRQTCVYYIEARSHCASAMKINSNSFVTTTILKIINEKSLHNKECLFFLSIM